MADLIKFGIYTPPAPNTYSVKYDDVNGNDSKMEDGTDYVERVRSDIPHISVGWTNITQDDVDAILEEVNNDVISVSYLFGTVHTCDMTASGRSLNLKLQLENETYWDLSFSLDG